MTIRKISTFIIKSLWEKLFLLLPRQYGLTVRQLRKENRDLRFPQVGDFVRIPGAKKAEIQETEQVKTDTVVSSCRRPASKS